MRGPAARLHEAMALLRAIDDRTRALHAQTERIDAELTALRQHAARVDADVRALRDEITRHEAEWREHTAHLARLEHLVSHETHERAVQHAAVVEHLAKVVDATFTLHPTVVNTEVALGEFAGAWARDRNERDARSHHVLEALRLIAAGEPRLRERLVAARRTPDFDLAYTEPEPLVTIIMPTADNPHLLIERSIPSVLAQTYEHLELLVVGDEAPPETEAAVRTFDDPRVRYVNLSIRGAYPESGLARWHVAGAASANHGLSIARGRWLVLLGDDDAMRPGHLATLLTRAREDRLEVAYGRFVRHRPGEPGEVDGVWPPSFAHHCQQASIEHAHLRFFEFALTDAHFEVPADWGRTERMLRAGVQFGMVQDEVIDYFPSRSWRTRAPLPEDL